MENYLLEIGAILVLLICVLYAVQWYKTCNPNETISIKFGYSDSNGPNNWKHQFSIHDENQSPINILSVCAKTVPCENAAPLDFSTEYHTSPQEMVLINDGHTVSIYSRWENRKSPLICGGPLCGPFKVFCMRLRWGPNDEEGSEHMIDMKKYAMELQVVCNKTNCKCIDMAKSAQKCGVLIISYIFEVTSIDNPFFEPIINGLRYIQFPCKGYCMRPFPISLLAPMFTRRYFYYKGSLTYPPCAEGVQWIVQPEPLTISSVQVAQFRKLVGFNGYILSNTRPVQNTNNRDVIFYE